MAETIKEFLVGLGYKVDGASEDKFKRSVETATKAVGAMALSLAAATAAVSAAITKIAAGFDELYWTSQRTKASAENIKAVGYAVSQLGGSYRGAVSSIEELARRMRSNPGYEAMARNLGVVTRENGKLRDTTAIMTDLAKVLSKKPQYVALQYLEALGIDEATYNALKSGDLVRYTEEYRKKQQALGVDQQRAAEIGKDLTSAWRALGATAQTVGEKLMQELGPGLKDFVERVDAFLMRNSDRIVEFFKKAAELVGKLMDAFVQLVEKGEGPIVAMFDKIMKSVDSLEKVLMAFAAFLVGTWLVSILGAFARVGTGWAAMLLGLGINPATLLAGGILVGSTTAANAGEDQEIARRRANGSWGGSSAFNGSNAIVDRRNWWERTMPKWLGGKDSPAKANISASAAAVSPEGRALLDTIASTEANSYDVMYGGKKFSSYADHPRVNVPITSGPNAGRTSSAAGRYQFLASTWDAQAKKLGLSDFSPANQDIAAYDLAKSVYRRKTGRELDSDLKSKDPAVISGIGSALAGTWTSLPGGIEQGQGSGRFVSSFNRFLARQNAQSGYTPSYTPFSGINAGSMAAVQSNASLFGSGITPALTPPAGGGTNIDMQQKTEITILGGGDPQATASAVSDAQNGVNGRLLRNMQGATR